MASEPLLTAPQVAELLSVSDESVRSWAKQGLIPSVTLPSGRLRFRRSDVDAVLAGGTAPLEATS